MIECPACGKNCMPTATRCKWCGTDFAEQAVQGDVKRQQASYEAQSGMASSTKTLIAVGITLAALGIFAIVVFWLADYHGWVFPATVLALVGVGMLFRALWLHWKTL